MATTVSVADLTIITREIITLGGNKYDSQHTQTIGGIKEVTKRIITVPTASTGATVPSTTTNEGIEILSFTDTLSSGPYKVEDVRYLRITNLDDTNHATIQFFNNNGNVSAFKLPNGGSFLYTFDKTDGTTSYMQSSDDNISNQDSTVDFTSGSTTVTCDPNPNLRVGTALEYISGSTTLYNSGSKITAILTTGSATEAGLLGAVTSFQLNEAALLSGNDQLTNFKYGLAKLRNIYASADADNVDLEVFVASV